MKIVVVDTWGGRALDKKFVEAFPNATFIDHLPDGKKPTREPHPHGGMVASRILMPLIDKEVEVHFVPMLNEEIAPADALAWVLEVLAGLELGPRDLVNCSWGADRPKNSLTDGAAQAAWQPWVEEEFALREDRGYWICFAAGNTNTGGLAYRDVGYPARLMKETVIVGAIDRRGVVAYFSADGNVTCVDMGHYAYVMNPLTGLWELASGTSFSSPSTCGTLGDLVDEEVIWDYEELVAWFGEPGNVTWPKGFSKEDLPHPAFGYGQMMGQWEKRCRDADAFNRVGLTAERVSALEEEPLRWFEFIDLARR